MKIAALKIYTLATNSPHPPTKQHTLPEGEGLGWCPSKPALHGDSCPILGLPMPVSLPAW